MNQLDRQSCSEGIQQIKKFAFSSLSQSESQEALSVLFLLEYILSEEGREEMKASFNVQVTTNPSVVFTRKTNAYNPDSVNAPPKTNIPIHLD